jgi:hypothetical protein
MARADLVNAFLVNGEAFDRDDIKLFSQNLRVLKPVFACRDVRFPASSHLIK